MKKRLFSFIFIFIYVSIYSQNWQWARSCTGNGDGYAVITDAGGNVYITGGYDGNLIAGTYTLSSVPGDCYLIKYDPNGNVVWARTSVTSGTNGGGINPYGVCNDALANTYVAGSFNDTLAVFGAYSLANVGTYGCAKAFLVKYDAAGNVNWAKSSVDTFYAETYACCCDINNNVYATGSFWDPYISFGSYTLANTGAINTFLTKYDTNGNVLWATASVGTGSNYAMGVSSDPSGNTFVTGYFSGPSITFGTYTLTNSGSTNVFLVKYDPTGNVIWAKNGVGVGLNAQHEAFSVSSDPNGDIYITGTYQGAPIVFDTYTLSETGYPVFVTKYNTNGNVLWAKSSTGNGVAYSVSSFSSGAFVAGAMDQTGGQLILGSYTLTPPVGYSDPSFITRLDLNGNILYAEAFKSGGDDYIDVSVDKYCNAFLAGDFGVTMIIGNDILITAGAETPFVAKLPFSCQALPDGTGANLSANSEIIAITNPCSGTLRLQINGEDDFELHLMNSLGQKVLEQKVLHGINEIDVGKFSKGFYSYTLISKKQKIKQGKLVVE